MQTYPTVQTVINKTKTDIIPLQRLSAVNTGIRSLYVLIGIRY